MPGQPVGGKGPDKRERGWGGEKTAKNGGKGVIRYGLGRNNSEKNISGRRKSTTLEVSSGGQEKIVRGEVLSIPTGKLTQASMSADGRAKEKTK